MTCKHVIGLIDAGSFADYPRDHQDAARAHARQCSTCGPALEAAQAVTTRLRTLPNPALPRDLTKDILARAAAVDLARRAVPVTATAGVTAASRALWVPASVTALTAAAVVSSLASAGLPLFRVTPFSGLEMPSTGGGMFQLLAGLALYAFGLLVPVRRGRRRLTAS
jgi:hypothetical protein